MPFFFSGIWMLPMFIMPLMAFFILFFLYKKWVFDAFFSTLSSQDRSFSYESDKLIEKENNSALKIINRRYAEGDLSTEEYRELKHELQN